MAGITHFYAPPEAHHDEDFPPPLVVSVEELSSASIEQILDFLCANVALRYDMAGFDSHLGARPIEVEVAQGPLRISERAYWYLLNEGEQGRSDGIQRYLAAVDTFTDDEPLRHCTCLDVVGGVGIYAYLDRYLPFARMMGRKKVPGLSGAIDAFQQFLERCDIDHEAWHFRYVERLLEHLRIYDRDRFMKLFLFYLGTQWRDDILSFEFLSPDHVLKDVVDHYIAENRHHLKKDVLLACAYVYGSKSKLADDVLVYCKKKTDFDVSQGLSDYHQRQLERVRDTQDATLRHWSDDIDTGFHRFIDGAWT